MNTINSRRRVMLRGAVVTGCVLGAPILFGCGREQEAASPAPEASSSGGAGSPNVAAEAKVSQADVRYQDTPNGDERCNNCMHFIAESNECKLVEGRVSPEGWCTLWVQPA